MKKAYVMSICQNRYQEDRVKNFLKTLDAKILNPNSFCYKHGGPFSWKDETYGQRTYVKNLMKSPISKADEVMIVLPRSFLYSCINTCYLYNLKEEEKNARKLRIKIRYFKINQFGRYVGRAHEMKRKELVN